MSKRKPVGELVRAHSWSVASAPKNKTTERQPHLFYRAGEIDDLFDQQAQLVTMLTEDLGAIRAAALKLAAAAAYTVGEYDGLHRLALAAAEVLNAAGNQGGRGKRHGNEAA